MAKKIGQWLGIVDKDNPDEPDAQQNYLDHLAKLKHLLDQGALTEEEFQREKALLLEQRQVDA